MLAQEFTKVLNEWLTPVQLAKINSDNSHHSMYGQCATHDVCDPNQAMLDAYERLWGNCPYAADDEGLNTLINVAWEVSKSNSFDIDCVNALSIKDLENYVKIYKQL